MFPTLMRRMAQTAKTQAKASTSPPKLRKVWPPDFSKLSAQEQLRFEKRYKRRINHIAQRPRWNKLIQISQLSIITFIVVYSVLFMDWKGEKQPFDDVRKYFWESLGYDYTSQPAQTQQQKETPNRSETWK